MSYPVEGVRKNFFERKDGFQDADDDDLAALGYTSEEIAEIKGKDK